MTADLQERASKIKLLLMDVDGVLTDGKFYFLTGPDGEAIGNQGLQLARRHSSSVVEAEGHHGRPDQWTDFPGYHGSRRHGGFPLRISRKDGEDTVSGRDRGRRRSESARIAYIGDDSTDVVVMHRVGLSIANEAATPRPSEADSHFITTSCGGSGAGREAVRAAILQAQGPWNQRS